MSVSVRVKKLFFAHLTNSYSVNRFIYPFLSQLQLWLKLLVPLFCILAILCIVEQIHLFAPNKLCNIPLGTQTGKHTLEHRVIERVSRDVTYSLTLRLLTAKLSGSNSVCRSLNSRISCLLMSFCVYVKAVECKSNDRITSKLKRTS